LRGCDLAVQLTGHPRSRIQRGSGNVAIDGPNTGLIRAGEREKALQTLQRWIEDNVSEYLLICDPYMGPEEVSIVLRMVNRARLAAKVSILTSLAHHRDQGLSSPCQAAYTAYWSSASDQEAPETLIMIVGLRSSMKSPVHPRWWITKDGGLRVDTSLRSLGGARDSEVFPLSLSEAQERRAELLEYFELKKREHDGEKLHIDLAILP
jgi:hypothetical protein